MPEVFKRTGCSSGRPGFNPQKPNGGSQTSVLHSQGTQCLLAPKGNKHTHCTGTHAENNNIIK